jgi:hypothetical protein
MSMLASKARTPNGIKKKEGRVGMSDRYTAALAAEGIPQRKSSGRQRTTMPCCAVQRMLSSYRLQILFSILSATTASLSRRSRSRPISLKSTPQLCWSGCLCPEQNTSPHRHSNPSSPSFFLHVLHLTFFVFFVGGVPEPVGSASPPSAITTSAAAAADAEAGAGDIAATAAAIDATDAGETALAMVGSGIGTVTGTGAGEAAAAAGTETSGPLRSRQHLLHMSGWRTLDW